MNDEITARPHRKTDVHGHARSVLPYHAIDVDDPRHAWFAYGFNGGPLHARRRKRRKRRTR